MFVLFGAPMVGCMRRGLKAAFHDMIPLPRGTDQRESVALINMAHRRPSCRGGISYADFARKRAKWKRPGRREMGTHNRQRASVRALPGLYFCQARQSNTKALRQVLSR